MSSFIGRVLVKTASSFSVAKRRRPLQQPSLFLKSYATRTTTAATAASAAGGGRSKTSYKLRSTNIFEPTAPSGEPKPGERAAPKAVADAEWAGPSEIPFQAKIANSVNLIGRVHIPVQFEASPDGKCWAGTVITQENDSDSSPLWIPIIFEGNLAHVAACHLKEKDCVHVVGQLSADPPHLNANRGQANMQVIVHSLNFVQGYSQIKKIIKSHKKEISSQNSASLKPKDDLDQSWNDLLSRPHEWWDIRVQEDNPNGAAFEQKSNGKLLWIDDSVPKWIRNKLETMTFNCKTQLKSWRTGVKESGDSELKSWRELLVDPKQWWDYRNSKLSGLVKPKHPDFKSKVGGQALWLNRAPSWVIPELEGLEFDIHTKSSKQVKQHEGDELWKDLVENPGKWWDNRSKKRNARYPDFKHKETGDGLWLDSLPTWALPKLPPLEADQGVTIDKRDTLLF